MEAAEVAAAITALRELRYSDYRSLVSKHLFQDGEQAMWESLAAAHPADINFVDAITTLPPTQISSLSLQLFPILSKLSLLSFADVLRLLEFAQQVPTSHLDGLGDGIRAQISLHPDFGRALGEGIAHHSADSMVLRVWALAYSRAVPIMAAEFIVSMLDGSEVDQQLIIALATFLSFSTDEVSEIVSPKEDELAGLLLEKTTSNGATAWEALTSYAKSSQLALGYLLAAIESGNDEAIIAFSSSLFRLKATTVGPNAQPLEPVVKQLLAAGYNNENVRAHVDGGLRTLLFSSDQRAMVVTCLIEWGSADSDITEVFPNTFESLEHHQSDFIRLFTAWLLQPDTNFEAISSLLSRCVSTRAPTGIDKELFTSAEPVRQVKAMRRLLALTNFGPILCDFISQIAEMSELKGRELDFAVELLNRAFQEFPEATEQFLREKSKSVPKRTEISQVYRGVLANALRWRRVLNRLPSLNELRPTDEEIQVIRSLRVRFNRDVQKQAAEKSFFAQLVSTSHIAQGRRFASHDFKTPPTIGSMAQHSHSIELPTSELSDPMKGYLQRAFMLRDAQ